MPSPHQFPPRPSIRDLARGAAAYRAGYPCIPPTRSTRREDWIKGWKEAEKNAAYGPKVENAFQTAIMRSLAPTDDFGNPIAKEDRP